MVRKLHNTVSISVTEVQQTHKDLLEYKENQCNLLECNQKSLKLIRAYKHPKPCCSKIKTFSKASNDKFFILQCLYFTLC